MKKTIGTLLAVALLWGLFTSGMGFGNIIMAFAFVGIIVLFGYSLLSALKGMSSGSSGSTDKTDKPSVPSTRSYSTRSSSALDPAMQESIRRQREEARIKREAELAAYRAREKKKAEIQRQKSVAYRQACDGYAKACREGNKEAMAMYDALRTMNMK